MHLETILFSNTSRSSRRRRLAVNMQYKGAAARMAVALFTAINSVGHIPTITKPSFVQMLFLVFHVRFRKVFYANCFIQINSW